MGRATTTDTTLDRLVAEITRVSRPDLVLLFGSRAAGTPDDDSDYDLMLVFPDHVDAEPERRVCHSALWDCKLSADLLARTASEYRRQQHDAGFLDWIVSREGIVLHSTGALEQRVPAPRVREEPTGFLLWVERATADLTLAEQSAASGSPVPDAICFHAHAAIEKLLKSRIAAGGTFPPRTHELAELLALQAAGLAEDAELRAACSTIDELYPRSRYPELPMPALDDAGRALNAARVAWVRIGERQAR